MTVIKEEASKSGKGQRLPEQEQPSQRNDFIEPTALIGSFVQLDPDPVVFDAKFDEALDELAANVTSSVANLKTVASRFK